MNLMDARRRNASAFRFRFSQGEPPASAEPCERAFDDPSSWQNLEAFGLIGALHDLGRHVRQCFLLGFPKVASLITAFGEKFFQEGMQAEQCLEHKNAAVAVLNIGGMNDGVQHQA